MRFVETPLAGACLIEQEPRGDERGWFARAFCAREFAEHGLADSIAQVNVSFNPRKGTLRGLHYQLEPAGESKLVRCLSGAIVDVIVDMRPRSATYRSHFAVELTSDNGLALYIPKMFAHGYQTLMTDSAVMYHVDAFYAPGAERGLRFDDPSLGIQWPTPVTAISEKDRGWPLLQT